MWFMFLWFLSFSFSSLPPTLSAFSTLPPHPLACFLSFFSHSVLLFTGLGSLTEEGWGTVNQLSSTQNLLPTWGWREMSTFCHHHICGRLRFILKMTLWVTISVLLLRKYWQIFRKVNGLLKINKVDPFPKKSPLYYIYKQLPNYINFGAFKYIEGKIFIT